VRVVLDTNIIISSIINKKGPSAKIRKLWESGVIEVATSPDILQEVERVINYPRIHKKHMWTAKQISSYMNSIREESAFVIKVEKLRVVTDDPDDDKFIECALTAKAKAIISGDPHLLSLKKYKNVSILSPREFIERYD
jgi:hypothetical protein